MSRWLSVRRARGVTGTSPPVTRLGLVLTVVLAAFGWSSNVAQADSGGPVGVQSYSSANGAFILTVDPRWNPTYDVVDPRLTLRSAAGRVLWRRGGDAFEAFDFPMHVCVADDGEHLVFGGFSVHNFQNYDEGLRFYGRGGKLLRFISRRHLPRGSRSISTAAWYDTERTRIEGSRLIFFTPGRDQPMELDIRTGEVLVGEIIENQGDDRDWFDWVERLRSKPDPESDGGG